MSYPRWHDFYPPDHDRMKTASGWIINKNRCE